MKRTTLYIGILIVGVVAAGYVWTESGQHAATQSDVEAPTLVPDNQGAQASPHVYAHGGAVRYRNASPQDISIATPAPRAAIGTPLVVTGSVRGSWAFEGSFPVTLINKDGGWIEKGYAVLEGDWMTDAMVPFTATLPYVYDAYTHGSIVLEKANPSDASEHDAAVEIDIVFSEVGE